MKHIALLLAALLVFSLTGCGGSEAAGTAPDTDKAGAYEVIPPEDGRGRPDPCLFGRGEYPGAGGRWPALYQHGKPDEREL